jgi:hypothetical protein
MMEHVFGNDARRCSSYKNTYKGIKGTALYATLQHWINPVKSINRTRINRLHKIKEGELPSVCFGHIKTWTVTLRIPRMREANIIKACGMVWALNKPNNLPPLPSTRQCPVYPFWMPTHANKKYDHWETQLSMQHDLQSPEQDRLPRILLCLHGCR